MGPTVNASDLSCRCSLRTPSMFSSSFELLRVEARVARSSGAKGGVVPGD